MNYFKLLPVLGLLLLGTSCASVRVDTDYDTTADFNRYKTYAFMKDGVDQMKVSDLDKKRILQAIDAEMTAKGFTKSATPDLLINLFTDAQQNVHVNNYYGGWGYRPWGWNPYMWGGYSPMWGGYSSVSTSTEGVLFVDILKAESKELIWQGRGTGYLTSGRNKKEARIKEFAQKILAEFPPQSK